VDTIRMQARYEQAKIWNRWRRIWRFKWVFLWAPI
jgi:hypothetical protein